MAPSLMNLEFALECNKPVELLVQELTVELGRRGFGVLSNIDVRKIIKQKLGEEMSDYVILDVCSPKHAKQAIDAHKEIGLVLPCKIIVYEQMGVSRISLYKPTSAIDLLKFGDLYPLAEEVESILKSAIESVISNK
jgi:uncharacterized protein (DUF302 family)